MRKRAVTCIRQLPLAVLLAALFWPAARAATPRLGPPEVREVVFETRYQFYVSGYRRPVVFDPVTYRPGELQPTAGPDELALRLLAARARGDAERYSELMTDDARQAFAGDLARQGLSLPQLEDRWRAAWQGLHAELTHHVYFGIQQLIRYRIFDPATGEERDAGELSFRIADDGRWRLFEAENQLFLQNWRFEGPEKTVEIDAPAPADGAVER